MLRVFVAKSPYNYDIVEAEDLSNKKIEDFPNWWILRSTENGGVAEDWRWAGIENPYPNDEIMSAAAFLCYMNHIVNPQYGRLKEIAYDGGDRLYHR